MQGSVCPVVIALLGSWSIRSRRQQFVHDLQRWVRVWRWLDQCQRQRQHLPSGTVQSSGCDVVHEL